MLACCSSSGVVLPQVHQQFGAVVAHELAKLISNPFDRVQAQTIAVSFNGKAALDWVMERQAVRTEKASGIVNDANDWAVETMGNPKYPLELFQRIITVSLGTQKIITSLPVLDI